MQKKDKICEEKKIKFTLALVRSLSLVSYPLCY